MRYIFYNLTNSCRSNGYPNRSDSALCVAAGGDQATQPLRFNRGVNP